MDTMLTKNHGLLGGTLDPSKHLQAAIPKLCTPNEIGEFSDRYACGLTWFEQPASGTIGPVRPDRRGP